ncbi:MAG: extracellular solute-binding protein [Pseudomonadota bacterium]
MTVRALALILLVTTATADDSTSAEQALVEVWHTFTVGSIDEEIFMQAVAEFEAANPEIDVEAVRIPYLQNLAQFINSSQGGEAPDLIRLSDTEVGKIGHISVEGLPLLEDLRPHLTPAQRVGVDAKALQAMRYENALYGMPVSQGALTLIYNRDLFDAAEVDYPTDTWTTDDLIAAAKALASDEVSGIALPLKWSYWYIPFQTGFGGAPFDAHGNPTLDSDGSAEALNYFLDLDRRHSIVSSSVGLESMSTQFQIGNAAMVLDGAWNWNNYVGAGLNIDLALMPTVAETGLRMRPMSSYFGWGVSKQSAVKEQAVELALWLASADVQKRFALQSFIIPANLELAADPDIRSNRVISGYLRQAEHGLAVPTNRGTSRVFEQIDTALELVLKGEMDAHTALRAADAEMERLMGQ